jgi:hypothetical protein
MAEYYGGDFIYSTLSTDAGVTALAPAVNIYTDTMVPETDTADNTINFYMSGNFNAALEYFEVEWSIDCRAKKGYTAIDMATAVTSAINRVSATVGGFTYFATAEILPVINPVYDADKFNCPVQVRVRRR